MFVSPVYIFFLDSKLYCAPKLFLKIPKLYGYCMLCNLRFVENACNTLIFVREIKTCREMHVSMCTLSIICSEKGGGYPLFTCRVENSKRRREGGGSAQVFRLLRLQYNVSEKNRVPPPPGVNAPDITLSGSALDMVFIQCIYDWVYIQSRSIMSWFLYISYLVCHLKLSYTCIKVKVLDKTEIKEETVTQI